MARTRPGGLGDRGRRGMRPLGCGSRRPRPHPGGFDHAFGFPGPGAFAPAALGVRSPKQPGSRVAPGSPGWLVERTASGCSWGVGARAAMGLGEIPAERQRPANQQSAGRVPCPASEIKGTAITWMMSSSWYQTLKASSSRGLPSGSCTQSPGGLVRTDRWAHPRVSIQSVWSEARERAFLSSQVKSLTLVDTALPDLSPLAGPHLPLLSPSLGRQPQGSSASRILHLSSLRIHLPSSLTPSRLDSNSHP